MFYVNIVIVNLLAWFALSYFWSFWTHKVFKPWGWLEMHKRRLIPKRVEHDERRCKDRVRYYTVFFCLEQVERYGVGGELVVLGADDVSLVALLREVSPERTVRVVGPMEATSVTVRRENCQGEVSEETVQLDFAAEKEVRGVLGGDASRGIVVKGSVSECVSECVSGGVSGGVSGLGGCIALALIDSVDYDELLSALGAVYSRLSPGGMMIVHSYNHDWEAVRRAVDVFSAGVKERFVPVADMYGSVVLAKS